MTLARRRVLAAALCACAGARAQPSLAARVPPELTEELPGARLQGWGRLRFLGLRIYDACLWVGARPIVDDWATVPFALELEYARDLKGGLIAERSIAEMQRHSEIAPEVAGRWLDMMRQLFPDVTTGERITGVNRPGWGARFFVNGALRGEPREPEFARVFFGIWLSPRTSEPALREALLGRSAP